MSSLKRTRLAELEAVAAKLGVNPADTQRALDARRHHWATDGPDRIDYANSRAAGALAAVVAAIAEAHAGCTDPLCLTCPPVRQAMAYILAEARHDVEREQP